jgi:predicted RNA binding protein YcfA (HicA-like mRNA interferase family)
MKLPRDLSGRELVKKLERLEYQSDHQTGSHIRLTTELGRTHSITIPNHAPLKIGTLSAILRDVSEHAGLSRDELIDLLFSK